MSEKQIREKLKQHFPALHAALPELAASTYQLINLAAQSSVFDMGGNCEHYLLLTQGVIDVKMISKSGKSFLLYRVEPGQSCVITTSCLLGNTVYPTLAQAQTDLEALSISRIQFDDALNTSALFRKFVFSGLGNRLANMMERIESINFTPIDNRIAAILINHCKDNKTLHITHEALAEEVGTAREVISRHLKKWESKNIVKLHRGHIQLNDMQYLSGLCD